MCSLLALSQNDHTANLRRFAAHFGACPETCSAIFVDFQMTQIATARIAKPQVFDFLMAMFWLKTYPTEHQTAGTFKVVSCPESSAMDTKNTSLSLRLFVSLPNTSWRMATLCLMFKLEILVTCILIFLAAVK